jgi:type I restriction enzyme S subunit
MNQQFKNTKIGEIPIDWEVVKFKEIVSVDKRNLTNKTEPTYSFKYISLSDVKLGKINQDLSEFEFENAPSRARRIINKGDILFATVRPNLKAFAFIENQDNNLIASTGFAVLTPKPKVLGHFLYHLTFSNFIEKQLYNLVVGSNYPAINSNDVKKLQIPLPPLPEQKKIAEILTTWDNAINKTTALIKAKEVLKKGLMQGLLLGKVQVRNGQKEEFKKTKLGVIPKHWTLKNAGDIFKSISIKNNENEELLAATQAKGIIPKRLLETNYTMPSGSTNGYKLVQDGNFVISLRSFQGGIEYSEYQGIISPAYTILTNKIPIDKTFFRYFFKSTEFIGRLSVAVIGIRDGKQISFQDFSAMTFRFPPLEEQTKIANILETADKEIDLLKKELAKIEEQKRGLMQVLLTGKVRVKV